MKKTVDQYLAEVNYSDFSKYVPSDFALSVVNLIKLINGEDGAENKTPVAHMMVLDNLLSYDSYKYYGTLNLCCRGFAKSTLMEYLIFYIAVFGELPTFGDVEFALYVSDSIENGVKTMRKSLEYRWQNSEFLQKYIPEARFTDVRWDFINIAGHKLTVRGYGARTGVRGTREGGKRPQLAILDDLISDEDARSPTIVASIEDTIYKAIDYALHPTHRKIIWNGTPFNQNDPIYKAVESGTWAANVFPVCEQFHENMPVEKFRSVWPDRFTYSYVSSQFEKALKSGKVDAFYQELMLQISPEGERLIDDSDIQWYDGHDLMGKEWQYNWYITTDFAVSQKQKADNSVISVWAYNSAEQWMLQEGKLLKKSMDKNIDILFDLVVKYNVKAVGIEVNGQQKAFVDWIRKEMHARNIYFRIVEVRRSTDKLTNLHNMMPTIRQGKLWFNKRLLGGDYMTEALNELKRTTPSEIRSAHDDWLDTLSMLLFMEPWRPAVFEGRGAEGGEDPFMEDAEEEVNPIEAYIV